MKYALFEGKRVEPKNGLRAVCPYCGDEVIAKCGSVKMHHWAHKTELKCDIWKESERPWHRSWKNQFPTEWQEQIFFDQISGEKHIADVCTELGFVIEFQHSPISEEEKQSREHFYKNMCWVIDASKVRDRNRFFKKGYIQNFTGTPYYLINNPREALPVKWADRTVFIFLDFKGESDDLQFENLWCLVPIFIQTTNAIAIQISRQYFIDMTKNGVLPSFLNDFKIQLNKKLNDQALRWHIQPIRK